MAAPTIGRRRFAPRATPQIDWSHPLAQSMAFCYVPAVGPVDLVTGTRATLSGSPAPSSSELGAATSFVPGTSDYLSFALPDAAFLGPVTWLWQGKTRSASRYNSFFHKHAAGGGNNSPVSFLTLNGTSPQRLTASRATAAGNRNYDTNSGALTVGVESSVVVTYPTGDVDVAPTIYCNGLAYAATGAGTGTGAAVGSSAALQIGRRADGAVQLDGTVTAVMVWSRAMATNEVVALYADLFQMLRY